MRSFQHRKFKSKFQKEDDLHYDSALKDKEIRISFQTQNDGALRPHMLVVLRDSDSMLKHAHVSCWSEEVNDSELCSIV